MNRKPVILYKTLIVGIIVLFIGVGVQPASSDVSLNTITFSGIIQDMINNASAGETIYIPRGAHYENIVIDKSINLIGEDKNTTVIDGGGFGDVVLIKADWVNFSGFTIQNCGEVWNDAGIFVISNYNNIYNNNIISNDETGIYLFQCSYNTISYNVISNIGWVGIYIVSSDNNIIRNNVINMNNNTGIEIVGSGGNKILSNTISKNEYGTIITQSYIDNNNSIKYNIISKCMTGICIVNSQKISIELNNICYNVKGIELYDVHNSYIIKNNFILNIKPFNCFNGFYCFSGLDNFVNLNYWNRPRLLPKLIWNLWGPKFDFHPAFKPYNINV